MIPLLLQIKKMNLNQYHTGHTFEKDLTKKDEILTHLLIITENLAKRLRKEKLKTNSIGITIRLSNFTDLSKQKASIDEGYIEVTGIIKGNTIEELKKNSIIYAQTLQNDVKNTLGFTINIRYK